MWIVKLALDRPSTFIVLAVAILIAGGLAILRIPTDIFPGINIPVISVYGEVELTRVVELALRALS